MSHSTLSGSAAARRAMHALRICFAVTLSLLGDASAARILGLFPHTGRSHQMVFEPLLKTLAERGHHVTVVSFFPLKSPPQNYTDVSLEGISQIGVETFDISWIESAPAWPKAVGIDRVLEQILGIHPLAEMATSICSKLVELPALQETMSKDYDVVLVENFNSDCMLGLMHVYGLQAPKVSLLSCNIMPWSSERIGVEDNPSFVPTLTTRFTSEMTFIERLENTVMKYVMKHWFYYFVQAREQEILESRFGTEVDLPSLALNSSLVLVNSFHALNGVRPMVPGVVEIGGLHLSPTNKPIPEYIERFLNESTDGVILFSWGSLIKTATIPRHKEEMLVRVLSKLPQRVVWKYEHASPEGNLTGNILRVPWISQYEILQHHKVIAFIAHGGLLSMTEAISAGKPMLCVPFFGDQFHNAAAATKAGLGTVVRYADLDGDTFSEGLQKTLSAQLRLSARQASLLWRDRQAKPLDTAVYWVERVARWGHASTLHGASRNIPFYQLALLDITGAGVLAVLLLLLLLKQSLKLVMNSVTSIFKSGKKMKTH